jgi:hypothetical protein
LDALELSEEEELDEAAPRVEDGVHPDRVKATGNGAGPNGRVNPKLFI